MTNKEILQIALQQSAYDCKDTEPSPVFPPVFPFPQNRPLSFLSLSFPVFAPVFAPCLCDFLSQQSPIC